MKFSIGDVVTWQYDREPRRIGRIQDEANDFIKGGYWVEHLTGGISFVHRSSLRLDDPFEQFVRETRFAAGLDKLEEIC